MAPPKRHDSGRRRCTTMNGTQSRIVGGIGVMAMGLVGCGEPGSTGTTARAVTATHAEIVTNWNARAVTATVASGQAPTLRGRTIAIMHVSMFDAVDLIEGGYHVYAADVAVPPGASAPAAAAAAAHRALTRLF